MRFILRATLATTLLVGCSSNDSVEMGGSGGTPTGGSQNTGGSQSAGGSPATGGAANTGGAQATGGNPSTGGDANTGGSPTSGGSANTGGSTTDTGGSMRTGGSPQNDGGLPNARPRPEAGMDSKATPDTQRDTTPPGDAAGFQPCPTNGDVCKILPLGDSITWGMADEANAGYRGPLFATIVAARQKITFTGSVQNGPATVAGQTFPKRNEGHSGWTIDQIANQIPSPATTTANGGIPHIVLLMIGTNDVYAASGQAQMATRLGSLLDKVTAAAPEALVVVAKITPLSIGNYTSTIKTYNDAIPGVVQTRVAQGKHLLVADMNTGFPTSQLADGVHPNTNGYKEMAKRWYAIIGDLLPK